MEGRKGKTSMGRRKIPMKKIAGEQALQVCFSKRRTGLFKKATELSVMCDAEVAIVVYSPRGKPFSFGHPSVDSVAHRYLSDAGPSGAMEDSRHFQALRDYGFLHTELVNSVDAAKKKRAMLEDALKSRQWDGSLEGLGLEDLETLRKALEDLKMNVRRRMEQHVLVPEPHDRCNVAVPNNICVDAGNDFLFPNLLGAGLMSDGTLMPALPAAPFYGGVNDSSDDFGFVHGNNNTDFPRGFRPNGVHEGNDNGFLFPYLAGDSMSEGTLMSVLPAAPSCYVNDSDDFGFVHGNNNADFPRGFGPNGDHEGTDNGFLFPYLVGDSMSNGTLMSALPAAPSCSDNNNDAGFVGGFGLNSDDEGAGNVDGFLFPDLFGGLMSDGSTLMPALPAAPSCSATYSYY